MNFVLPKHLNFLFALLIFCFLRHKVEHESATWPKMEEARLSAQALRLYLENATPTTAVSSCSFKRQLDLVATTHAVSFSFVSV